MSLRLSDATGYASAAYVAALGQEPLAFGATGGHLVRRQIGASGQVDLAGAWPIFTCTDWDALGDAVSDLSTEPVSLTLVSDPFAPLGPVGLAAIFPICRPLHDHWIIDLVGPPVLSKHHRRKLRQAPAPRIMAGPADAGLAGPWARIYAHLVAKKHIADARAFSAESLLAQLMVPGAQVVTAWQDDNLLGVDLYYLDRGVAFAHLSAYAPQGYDRSVSYPMLAAAIDHFAPMAHAIDLGGAPGGGGGAGIAHFKSGWTRQTRPTFLCGKVLNPAAYARLAPGADPAGWFPAHRAGEYTSAV